MDAAPSHPTPTHKLLPSRGGGDWPGKAAVWGQRPKIGLASSRTWWLNKTRALDTGARRGLLRNAGSRRGVPAGPREGVGRGVGVCTFFGARPRGQRGAEQQQQPEPQGPAPLHGAGPGPGTAALTAGPGLGDWASRDGPAGAGGRGRRRGRSLGLTWITFLKGQ